MAKLITVNSVLPENDDKFCKELESGNILFFPKIPFKFPKEEIEFLLKQKQSGSKNRKNIAYKPKLDKVTNVDKGSADHKKLLSIMRNYSKEVKTFLEKLLFPYKDGWKIDYASFRPFQEKGRDLRIRARNDLLHVDSFPTRPMHGNRILRFFTNINPNEGRKWITSYSFEELAIKYGGSEKLPFPKRNSYSPKEKFKKLLINKISSLGLSSPLRSPYDDFMLRMHHFLKENKDFQKNCKKDAWEFPPNSCWMVFTDSVTHAALSGQFALEQTFIIPKGSLISPEISPVSVLERLTGYAAIDSDYNN